MRHLALALLAAAAGTAAGTAASAQEPASRESGASAEPAGSTPFFVRLQAPNGHWSARDLGRVNVDPTVAVPGREIDDMAVTAALTWVLIGEGNTTTKGPSKRAVKKADEWLRHHLGEAAKSSKDVLVPGEALAFAVLADLNQIEHNAVRARLLATEMSRTSQLMSPDGSWWEGPSTPIGEATGWVNLARFTVGKTGRGRGKQKIVATSRDWFRDEGAYDHTAAAFGMYLEAANKWTPQPQLGDEAAELGTRFQIAGATADRPGPAARYAYLAATYRIGGRLFATHSKLMREELERTQLRDGPWKGGWPPSGDPRGSLWDFAWHMLSLQCVYRYAGTEMVR